MESQRALLAKHSSLIAREGWVFIFLFGAFAFAFLFLGVWYIGAPLFLLTLFTFYFFRNPESTPPKGEDIIISPADGKIINITDLESNRFTNSPAKKVSIFMSVFNVHVNRVPISGKVKDIQYHPGKFIVASRDKASEANERNAILLDIGKDSVVAIVQIAGLIARRIVCYLSRGDEVSSGERLGLIRFGSRVDLYLPVQSCIDVSVGENVKAGSTVIGRLK